MTGTTVKIVYFFNTYLFDLFIYFKKKFSLISSSWIWISKNLSIYQFDDQDIKEMLSSSSSFLRFSVAEFI